MRAGPAEAAAKGRCETAGADFGGASGASGRGAETVGGCGVDVYGLESDQRAHRSHSQPGSSSPPSPPTKSTRSIPQHVISPIHSHRLPECISPPPYVHVISRPAHHRISSCICNSLSSEPTRSCKGGGALCGVERHTRNGWEHQELHRRSVCREQGDRVA